MKNCKLVLGLILLNVILLTQIVVSMSANAEIELIYDEETYSKWLSPQECDAHNLYPLSIKVKMLESHLVGGVPAATEVFIRKNGGPTYFDDFLNAGENTAWYYPEGALTFCDFINPYVSPKVYLWYKATVCMYVN